MNIFTLVWSYLKARPLNTAINILLLSLGIAVITILLLFNNQLEEKISDNAKGIDLVVGAKGSPLQLILCNIFHVDLPTGNIKLFEAERIAKNRLIKTAIPLALGDSYQGYRIAGTNVNYPELYEATLAQGAWWKNNLEVTIGANVAALSKLKLNDEFASAHGLSQEGHAHNEHHYIVKGIMKQTNSVLDNLILTNVESVWIMHETSDNPFLSDSSKNISTKHSSLVPSVLRTDSSKEITSLLIKYRSALAAIQLPRLVNSQSSLQAAAPAYETARLFSILGVGVDIMMSFAYVLILISALSIFIALYNSLKERRYDMAVMRTMGASRTKLLMSILMEGGLLTLVGSLIGLLMGHSVLFILSNILEQTQKAGITGLIFYSQEWIILAGSLILGVLCSLIPAIQAYKTDISTVLSGN
ncbi:FtsX-like permease family protein [Chryseolinea sp. H1M3-3]|uniref:ABC transporter permease n=1 Tax=Chryseolinea sp. H1M3-3 TaxID=3034144 RepID=UPI0023EE0ED3|nr:FtsX-like permease family protein [Chryseolinea sp. H1M3-3]